MNFHGIHIVAVTAGRVRAGDPKVLVALWSLAGHSAFSNKSISLLIIIIHDSDSVQLASHKLETGMPEPCVSNLFFTYLQTCNYSRALLLKIDNVITITHSIHHILVPTYRSSRSKLILHFWISWLLIEWHVFLSPRFSAGPRK